MITAQKCSFPFEYNSQNYTSCTTATLGYNWCAPTSVYNGQSIKCDPQGDKFTVFYITHFH